MKHTKNVNLGSNGVDRVRLLQEIPMRLRGTNFCTSSARFTPSFIRQPNGPECTQIVRNAPKCQFRVQWVGSRAFVVKNSARLRDTNYCTSSARFAPSFVRQPNGRKHTEVVRKHQNISLGSNVGGSDAFVTKNFDVTSWHELLH